jgi:hypothetical protein
METDPIVTECFEFDEVVSIVKRSRRQSIYLHVGMWAPYSVQNPAKPREQGATFSAMVEVTRKEAVRFLTEEFPAHHRAKLRLYVSESKRCMFVGSSPR